MSRIAQSALVFAKLVALTFVLLIASAVGSRLLPATDGDGGQEAAAAAPSGSFMALILAVFFLQAAALAYPILRSRWSGWRLTAAIFVVFFGTVTFLSQIESLVYMSDKMPDGMLAGLFGMGLVTAVVFAPIAVALLGRWVAPGPGGPEPAPRWPAWPWGRVAIAGLVYVALYYLFGYYVAWQSPAVREFYGGSDPGSFFAQMASIAEGTPWMLPFQYLRGLLWAGLALLVVRSMKGRWWEAGLALAVIFAVPAFYLLFPNPLMPEEVRMVHLVETAPYQFLFGWFAAWWLRRREAALVLPSAEETVSMPGPEVEVGSKDR